ncbi:MAG: hypothetical protein ACI4TJ_01175 [Candidatus Cryptobacteroides sp.]
MKTHFKIFLAIVPMLFCCLGLLGAGNGLPYEFKYGGKVYKGYEGVIDGTLKVSVVRNSHPEFDEREYTVWFENVGDKPSKVLEDVYAQFTPVAHPHCGEMSFLMNMLTYYL